MIVYDLNSGHREYPGYDEIEDRRGGGRGRSRRSDGTYMGYGGGIYDHYGMHEKMKEMEERENELEERERRLEERERRHEMEDREYRRMGYESYPTDYYGDDRYYRCVEVADVEEVVLIEEQTQRIQLIRNM